MNYETDSKGYLRSLIQSDGADEDMTQIAYHVGVAAVLALLAIAEAVRGLSRDSRGTTQN